MRALLGRVRLDHWRLTCERCAHAWEVVGDPPEMCAACRSRQWDAPRGTLKRGRPPNK